MKLWLILQEVNNKYDTYYSAVVACETMEEAKNMFPGEEDHQYLNQWCEPEFVQVEYLGEAREGSEAGVICASFSAG